MIKGNAGKSKVLMIAMVAVLLVGCVAGVAVVKKSSAAKGKKEADKGPTVAVSVGELVVNLADTDAVRYLKVDIVLEMRGEVEAGGEGGHGGGGEAAGGTQTKVRDALIQTLSSKKFNQLLEPKGKEELKKEIIAAVNERLEGAEVVEVLFNEFAMQ